ncbi:MAG: energy transducer TonB [Chthoniobacterales bacterium]
MTTRLARLFCLTILLAIASQPILAVVAADLVMTEAMAKAAATAAPPPHYPLEALRKLWIGAGIYLLKIDSATGRVTDVKVERTTGHATLDKAAVDAFQRWHFRPGTLSAARIPVTFTPGKEFHFFSGTVRFIDSKYLALRVQGPHVTDTVRVGPAAEIIRNGKAAQFVEIRLLDHVEGHGVLNPPDYHVHAISLRATSPAGR